MRTLPNGQRVLLAARRQHLPGRPGRLAAGRPAVPRPLRPDDLQGGAAVPVRRRRVRDGRRPRGRRRLAASSRATRRRPSRRTTTSAPPARTKQALTQFPDPAPQLCAASRSSSSPTSAADGVTAVVHAVPAARTTRQGERLPTVVWAYPLEFNDADTAGQVTGSPHRFTTLGGTSHLFFLLAGLRRPRRRHDAGGRRPGDGQQHLHRADRRRCQGGDRQGGGDGRDRPGAGRRRRAQLRGVHDGATCSRTRTCSGPASPAAGPTTAR